MMSLFKAVTARPGPGGEGGGIRKESVCVCVCVAISRRGKSIDNLGGREITSRVFEMFLARFNSPCFS